MTGLPVAEDGSFVAARLARDRKSRPIRTSRGSTAVRRGASMGGPRVEILDTDVADVVLQLSEGPSVRGRVTIDDPGNDLS